MVFDDHQVGVKNTGIFRPDRLGDALLHFQNLRARGNESCFEPRYFGRDLRFIQFALRRLLVIGMM